ncbi:hypothetical protein LINPERHAP1_LOCUS21426 [Linum perenne]
MSEDLGLMTSSFLGFVTSVDVWWMYELWTLFFFWIFLFLGCLV